MITLDEPCALNTEFQHFILSFNKKFINLWIPLREGLGVERRPKDMVNLQISLISQNKLEDV
jgi:hypothetical protein